MSDFKHDLALGSGTALLFFGVGLLVTTAVIHFLTSTHSTWITPVVFGVVMVFFGARDIWIGMRRP